MRFLLIILIPISIFSQAKNYPDTIVTNRGTQFPCIITHLDQSIIKLKYRNGQKTSIGLIGLDKIFFDDIGIVYTNESGFTKEFICYK